MVLTRAVVGEFWLRRIFRIVPVFWLASAATVYPLARLVHQVVEKPGIGIGRRLAEQGFPRPERPYTGD